jgi:2-iminobutanoate/2-iminopropanoate deaminase
LLDSRKQTVGKGKVISKATVLCDLIFVSGIGPHDPKTGKQVVGGIREQTRIVMELMKAALEEAGSSLDDVLKCTVFLTDMSHYAEMNEIYGSYFTVAPARTCVQVSKLPRPEENVMIEIDAIACKTKK